MRLKKWLLLTCFVPALAVAQPRVDENRPIYMQADQLGYDNTNAIVIARGKVQIVQDNTYLQADRITYYQQQNIVRADGNVRVTDTSTGESYYADKVQLNDKLKQGIIGQLRVLMSDQSQFAASEAKKVSDTKTELKDAIYSPCDICEGESPFWQIRADSVTIDDEDQTIEYDDLMLEFWGVPVAYTPYFYHPTPDADRKSGFLKPEYSQDSNLGTTVRIPYYLAIAPDKDATITPFITSEEGLVLDGEYRQRTNNGNYLFNGSITYPRKRDGAGLTIEGHEIRGHIFANGHEQLNEHWRIGFDLQRSTDDTYLRKYDYGNYRSLNSRLFAEGVYGRSFVNVQSMAFQGLQINDDPGREPFILPLAEGYYESDPVWRGMRFYSSANTQVVMRKEGDQSRRLSAKNGLKLPVVTSGGHLIDVETSMRTDLYSLEDAVLSDGSSYSGEEIRVIPTVGAKWRYPLMKSFGDSSLTIEPTVMAVASSHGHNPDTIPNEDSGIIEFNNANLFSFDSMPGRDLVDEGHRVAYGVRGQWLFKNDSNIQFLFGQRYSAEDNTPFPLNNEDGEHFSDYVGRVSFDYQPFTVTYQFRLDQDQFSANNNTISAGYRQGSFNLRVDYISLEDDAFLADREEMLVAMAMALSDEWSISGTARRDLLNNDMLFAGAGLVYQNECFSVLTSLQRQFTRDRDVEPDTNISVRVSFKNLTGL